MVSKGHGKMPRPMEVWSADVPFEGRAGSKDRPVVILGRKGGRIDVMAVTTHPHDGAYMRPMEPYEAGLDSRSHIRTDRILRLDESSLNYIMGELGDDDAAVLRAKYERRSGRDERERSRSRDCIGIHGQTMP